MRELVVPLSSQFKKYKNNNNPKLKIKHPKLKINKYKVDFNFSLFDFKYLKIMKMIVKNINSTKII